MLSIIHILNFLRGNIKCLVLKFINGSAFKYNKFLRINSNVSIVISKGSTLVLGKGVLIGKNTVCSATDGGTLLIGDMVGVNNNSMIMCHNNIIIGDNTIMGPGVYIYDHDHLFDSVKGVSRKEFTSSSVIIGRNCWIGANSVILKDTNIGDNCLIAAGSVVKGSYPAGSIIIQKREECVKTK